MHPPARQREKDVHSAACCHVQRSKNHTPSRNAKKIGLDRVEQPKILLLPLVWTTMDYAAKTEILRIDMALLVSLALNVLAGSCSE